MNNESLKQGLSSQRLFVTVAIFSLMPTPLYANAEAPAQRSTLNVKDTGYRGIWYMNQPSGDPRTWTTARWTGTTWRIRPACTSDNNYDMGSLYIEDDGTWRIIGPTETGPQPYNPGGEMAMWISRNLGLTWKKVKQLTTKSPRNHVYTRQPVNTHPDFYAIWADGHGRKPSSSSL
jgi:hypothetical protein